LGLVLGGSGFCGGRGCGGVRVVLGSFLMTTTRRRGAAAASQIEHGDFADAIPSGKTLSSYNQAQAGAYRGFGARVLAGNRTPRRQSPRPLLHNPPEHYQPQVISRSKTSLCAADNMGYVKPGPELSRACALGSAHSAGLQGTNLELISEVRAPLRSPHTIPGGLLRSAADIGGVRLRKGISQHPSRQNLPIPNRQSRPANSSQPSTEQAPQKIC
jgi:hypothetical protein